MSLPKDEDAEKAFLSCVIQQSSLLNEVADGNIGKLFHHPCHRRIFDSALNLWKEGKDCDLVTLTDAMNEAGTLELSGGAAFLTECFISPAVLGNWENYLGILKRKHTARLAISAAERIIASAQNPADAGDLSEIVQKALVAVAADAETASSIVSIKEAAIERYADYEVMVKERGKLLGITTGFTKLDEITGGFRGGQLVVIGAPTKGGKTAMALNMAMRTSDVGGNSVGIISLEMSRKELVDRLIASYTGADVSRLSKEKETDQKLMNDLNVGASQLSKLKLFIRDESSMNCLQLRAAVRRMVAVYQVKLVVVDYIQLLEPTDRKDSRERQVADASRTLKMLAKEMGIVIIALTQLNADGNSRESRAIEHDCDLFLTINQSNEEPDHWFLNIRLARACPKSSIPITFVSEFLRFDERHER